MATNLPFFAVRVVLYHPDKSTTTRDYVRGSRHVGRDVFSAWALGDLLRLATEPGSPVSWEVHEVDFPTVQEARLRG